MFYEGYEPFVILVRVSLILLVSGHCLLALRKSLRQSNDCTTALLSLTASVAQNCSLVQSRPHISERF
ncbi:hypothetical protein K431DRAFT_283198 [Polychaeton citri CBS 116435]|uniref:Uncharacterized protein n=1 Tax=Polychaeton citri CBS 116435 TaxID=1314669 RepID=A0A9P4Q9E0_9PEZI|nr:hypothetical protein K431DRAFT_283198 [Polychaeton citri CBS 116435]